MISKCFTRVQRISSKECLNNCSIWAIYHTNNRPTRPSLPSYMFNPFNPTDRHKSYQYNARWKNPLSVERVKYMGWAKDWVSICNLTDIVILVKLNKYSMRLHVHDTFYYQYWHNCIDTVYIHLRTSKGHDSQLYSIYCFDWHSVARQHFYYLFFSFLFSVFTHSKMPG